MRVSILLKLVLAFALPTVLLFAGFAYVTHRVARSNLEAELGVQLQAVAGAAATAVRGRYLVELQAGDEDDRAYLFNLRKLQAVQRATGVARIYVFDRDFRVKVATDPASPVGSEHFYAQLHRVEIQRVFADGRAASTVLFTGHDGKQYMAGYAPVRASEDDPEVVLVLGVDAAPTYFDRLAELRRRLLLYGVALLVFVVLIAVLVATRITRPVRALAGSAERIGEGNLDAPIAASSHDEIGFLAETMEDMRRGLRARDERMQMMLAGVAHEVRNPLAGMRLFAGILRDEIGPDQDGDDEAGGHVRRIEKELGYLDVVVSEFLDYARRPSLELGDVDLARLTEEVLEVVRGLAEELGVAVSVEAEPVSVRADAGQLRRALLNLGRNAVEAAGDGGQVSVRVSAGPHSAVVVIRNSGQAIATEVAEHIFEPFFTTKEKGTGLGLAFAFEIVREHGGELRLLPRVEDADMGVAFEITLPAIGQGV